jgi:DNA-binding NarL/FixJ family response regulator
MTQEIMEKETTFITILLVSDHALIREGLRSLLALQKGLQVVSEATDCTDVPRLVERFQPAIVLVDMHHAEKEVLAMTQYITRQYADCAVIVLTSQCHQPYMKEVFRSGGRGYLLTSSTPYELSEAIQMVHDGGTYVSRDPACTLASDLHRASKGLVQGKARRREPRLTDVLSDKELEIVRHVASGMSNKEIANTLAYSEKTVKNYLSIIFQKLNIRDRTQAAILAMKQGVLTDWDV